MAGVPDSIIFKAGPLTRAERRELQEHTELGHAMLSGSGVELLDTAADIALTHHERWDGAGYPRGPGGRGDPARGPDRRRRGHVGRAHDRAPVPRDGQRRGSAGGAARRARQQFDPRVLDAFLGTTDEALEIRERFPVPAGDQAPAVPGTRR